MRNHYPGRVTPYVLDDSASPALKAMARQYGFAYATRPDRGWFKKAGNLRFGFQISDGEYILLLDADFAPRPDTLEETVPYLDMYPDVGIVQTPQFFHVLDQQTWVERGAGAIQELFYRSIQTARAKKGGAICVGSCAVYRRTALEANGGMSLAEHSEDLWTGFDLHRLGWRLRYLPVALSTGNCPDNILAFLGQQYRWCSGTMSLLKDRIFWKTTMPLYTRLCYLTGFIGYVYTAVFTFVAPALAVGMLLFVPGTLLLRNLIFIAPVLFYAGVIYPMWHRAPYRLEAWSVRVISGWAHVFALSDIAPRAAARLAAVRQRRGPAGRQAALLGRPDPLERRIRGAVGGPGPVAHDDHGPLQLLPPVRARPLPARGGRPDPHPAESGVRVVKVIRAPGPCWGCWPVLSPGAACSPPAHLRDDQRPERRGRLHADRPAEQRRPYNVSALLHPATGKYFGIEAERRAGLAGPGRELRGQHRPQAQPRSASTWRGASRSTPRP